MKKVLVLVILFTIVISTVGVTAAATPVQQAQAQAQKIVCIGDSITLGPPNPNNWPYHLQQRLGPNWQVINQGVAGDTTTGMLARINASLAYNPKYVIIAGGVNDGLIPPSTTDANIARMCDLIVAHGATPILCTLTPQYHLFAFETIHTDTINAWIPEYAHAHGYAVIDFHAVINESHIEPFLGLHPNDAGYAAMANSIDLCIFR
jgi:acyl-CoA thioesterase-1